MSVTYLHQNSLWCCTILPQAKKALVGIKVENPERYSSVKLSFACGLERKGVITPQGQLLFWKPFRMVSDHLEYHWNNSCAPLMVMLTEKDPNDNEPLLELEWTDTDPNESEQYHNLIFIYQQERNPKFESQFASQLVDFPTANNVFQVCGGMMSIRYDP